MGRVPALAVVAVCVQCASAGVPSLHVVSGGSSAFVHALSPEGTIAGGGTRLAGAGPSYAFGWSEAGGLSLLQGGTGLPLEGRVMDMSAGGAVKVGIDGTGQAFRSGGGFTPLGFLPGDTRSEATGITPGGSVIVGYSMTSSTNSGRAWRRTGAGALTLLPVPFNWAPVGNEASCVDDSGSIVGGWAIDPAGKLRGVRWVGNSLQAISMPDEVGGTFVLSMTPDGQTVVGTAASPRGDREAFVWSASSGGQWLGDLVGSNFHSHAMDISADGSVIVGEAAGEQAFYWTAAGGMRPLATVLEEAGLDVSGWTFLKAFEVSRDGLTIAGEARAPGSNERVGFVAVIPSPGGIGVFVALGLSVARRRR